MRKYYSNAEVTLIAISDEITGGVDRENKYELAEHIIKQIIAST